jgi:bifunctional non-homologous end joining protein LigD
MTPLSTRLFFREGSSDKIYEAKLEAAPDQSGFVVTFAYGRRGSALKTGTKTSKPEPYASAVKIYETLVQSKTSKGYTVDPSGALFAHSENAGAVSGLACQLLNSIDAAECSRLVADPKWWMQEKKDGVRQMLRRVEAGVEGINRRGLVIGISAAVTEAATFLPLGAVIDGEAVGDIFYAFDCLHNGETVLQDKPYSERCVALAKLLEAISPDAIKLLPVAETEQEKNAWLALFKEANVEGIVFKRHDAPYKAGRPASGGAAVKFKFYETCSARVASVNLQRSVGIELKNDGDWVNVGNVTIAPNAAVPSKGDVIEVRYLYAYRGGSLYQPTYLGVRSDITADECTLDQLKFKEPAA